MKGLVTMAFTVPSFENIDIEIPDGRGKTLTITVPPLDCMYPADVEKMNKALDEIPEDTPNVRNPNASATALIQHMLAYYNPKKAEKDAIWSLVPRQVQAINDHWEEASGMSVGESVPSTDSSTTSEE